MQCWALTVFPSVPIHACAHLCCSFGGEDACAERVPVLFPVSHTRERPTSSHPCPWGVQPWTLHLIPAVCWLDTRCSASVWQGWCCVWARQMPWVYFLLTPLKYSGISKDLWTTPYFVIVNYLLLDSFPICIYFLDF